MSTYGRISNTTYRCFVRLFLEVTHASITSFYSCEGMVADNSNTKMLYSGVG